MTIGYHPIPDPYHRLDDLHRLLERGLGDEDDEQLLVEVADAVRQRVLQLLAAGERDRHLRGRAAVDDARARERADLREGEVHEDEVEVDGLEEEGLGDPGVVEVGLRAVVLDLEQPVFGLGYSVIIFFNLLFIRLFYI